jgi:hypothetical protein
MLGAFFESMMAYQFPRVSEHGPLRKVIGRTPRKHTSLFGAVV